MDKEGGHLHTKSSTNNSEQSGAEVGLDYNGRAPRKTSTERQREIGAIPSPSAAIDPLGGSLPRSRPRPRFHFAARKEATFRSLSPPRGGQMSHRRRGGFGARRRGLRALGCPQTIQRRRELALAHLGVTRRGSDKRSKRTPCREDEAERNTRGRMKHLPAFLLAAKRNHPQARTIPKGVLDREGESPRRSENVKGRKNCCLKLVH